MLELINGFIPKRHIYPLSTHKYTQELLGSQRLLDKMLQLRQKCH